MAATLPILDLRSPDRRRASHHAVRWHTADVASEVDPRATERAEAAAFDDDAVPFDTVAAPSPVADGGSGFADPSSPVETDDDDDVIVLSWYQRPINVLAIVIAVALIGGMVGWLISDARSDTRGND